MDRFFRPIPYPPKSPSRQFAIQSLRKRGYTYPQALAFVGDCNRDARYAPMPNEKCEARTRMGTSCRCKAMRNGRCKLHGGMSTGPMRKGSKE